MKKVKRLVSALLVLVMVLAMVSVSMAATGTNTREENAVAVTSGQTVTVEVESYKNYWYKIDVPEPGMYLSVERSENSSFNFSSKHGGLDYVYQNSDRHYYYTLNGADTYYFYVRTTDEDVSSITFTATLLAGNDANEPNNTEQNATVLTSGQPCDFVLGYGDRDWFSIETTRDSQDVSITIDGFDYESLGSFTAYVDDSHIDHVDGNGTYYIHFAEAGVHTVHLFDYGWHDSAHAVNVFDPADFTITATVLAGDANEPNDTRENATLLPVGTDVSFNMGGWLDEDWFTFESVFDAGEDSQLYTLNILDLHSNYSDVLYYDLYAPDGTLLMEDMMVNIRHVNVLACTQEGLYTLRLYRTSSTSPRTQLRIRVDEGGTDPHEANDTWLDAALVQTNQPVQFVLSNTADVDWFKFEVPEADMTLALSCDVGVSWDLYSGADLAEHGTRAGALTYSNSEYTKYYKFDDPGTYYVKLSVYYAQNISNDLRTVTFDLEAARDRENNDTRYNATPLYNGVLVQFDTTASNDDDWFVFEVPEGVRALHIYNTGGSMYLYRAWDFEVSGDNAKSLDYNSGHWTAKIPAAGTYYLKTSGRSLDRTVRVRFITEAVGTSIATAQPMTASQWTQVVHGGYYALGQLKAGDELRLYGENIGSVYLYNAAGNQVWSRAMSNNYSNGESFRVTADDTYYLRTNISNIYDADLDYLTGTLLFDVGSRELEDGEKIAIEVAETVTLTVGQSYTVVPRLTPYDVITGSGRELFTFQSGNSSVAAFKNSYNGLLTAKSTGSTTITVTARELNFAKTITIHVVDVVEATSVTIEGGAETLPLGQMMKLVAVLSKGSTDSVSWSSSDEDVLYVNSKGEVTAVGDGSAEITATTGSGLTDTVSITVTEAVATDKVTGITLNDYDLTIYMEEDPVRLTATLRPVNVVANVAWQSSNPAAATVDQDGLITPVAPGVTVITAQAGDYRASCVVTVQAARVRVKSIAFDAQVLEIPLGGGTTLLPIFTPSNATVKSVTWVSSDPNVAAVSRTGIVSALAVGETTITATTLDGGKQATILIRVTSAPQLGDINGDGYIDAADAMMTLQVVVGKLVLTEAQEKAADVNEDGWVDAADAVRILRYNAGLIDSLQG